MAQWRTWKLNVPNRTLYHGDNLDFMRGLNSTLCGRVESFHFERKGL